jgi:hypothetical protein
MLIVKHQAKIYATFMYLIMDLSTFKYKFIKKILENRKNKVIHVCDAANSAITKRTVACDIALNVAINDSVDTSELTAEIFIDLPI